jgi:hypothetical protein
MIQISLTYRDFILSQMHSQIGVLLILQAWEKPIFRLYGLKF